MSGRFLSTRSLWPRTKRPFIAAVILLVLVALIIHRHNSRRNHYIGPDGALSHITPNSEDFNDWPSLCNEHGFSAFNRPRKVYDLVLFSTELDWLEIRLHAHNKFVDYFVIVESPTTFTHKPKHLLLKENWVRFKDFHHKIIHRVVEDTIVSSRHWDHEDFLRNSLLHEVFPGLEGPRAAQKNDVLIVSDMDELIKPGALLLMRHCDFPKRLTLRSHFYYYSFQWLHQGEQWPHPQATTFGGSLQNTLSPNDLRMNLLGLGLSPFAAFSRWWNTATVWNAGWHCSSCFSTIKEMQTKMNSFSHQGWNTKDNRDAKTMLHRVRNGLDLFARPGETYDRVDNNRDIPEYVLDAHERDGRFKYMLDRDGEDAGFEDYR